MDFALDDAQRAIAAMEAEALDRSAASAPHDRGDFSNEIQRELIATAGLGLPRVPG